MSNKSVYSALLMSVFALSCQSGKKAINKISSLLQDDCIVTMVGEHKLPTEATIAADSVNFFAVKTKKADLFDSQEAIIKALKVEDAGPNRYRTLVPGTYKTTLQKDEFLIIGTYQYYHAEGNPEYHNFLEFMVKLEDGIMYESSMSTLFLPASQSEFNFMPTPRLIPNDGVMGQRVNLDNFKYSVKSGNEVTVEFPEYIDGRSFADR